MKRFHLEFDFDGELDGLVYLINDRGLEKELNKFGVTVSDLVISYTDEYKNRELRLKELEGNIYWINGERYIWHNDELIPYHNYELTPYEVLSINKEGHWESKN